MKDRFQQEEGFEGVKGSLAGRGAIPREVFLGEVNEGSGNVGVVRDETTVEVCKAKEGPDILDFFGSWPTGNSIQFDGAYGKLAQFDNHSEVPNFSGGKAVLFEFEMEV